MWKRIGWFDLLPYFVENMPNCNKMSVCVNVGEQR